MHVKDYCRSLFDQNPKDVVETIGRRDYRQRDRKVPESFYTIGIFNFEDHYTGPNEYASGHSKLKFNWKNLNDIDFTAEGVAGYAVGKCMLSPRNTAIRYFVPSLEDADKPKKRQLVLIEVGNFDMTLRQEDVSSENRRKTTDNIISLTKEFLECARDYENGLITSTRELWEYQDKLIAPGVNYNQRPQPPSNSILCY
jgi:hypothetical protein